MSPQLARRVAILGGTAFILFAALFFRLWFLEVLSGRELRLPGRAEPRPQDPHRGAARRHRRPPRHASSSRRARPPSPRSCRASCPRPRSCSPRRTARRSPPPSASASPPTSSSRTCAARAAGASSAPAQKREQRRLKRAANKIRPVADPAPARRPGGPHPVPPPRPGPRRVAAHHPPPRHPAGRADAVRRRHGQDRHRQAGLQLPAGAPGGVPGGQARAAVPAQLPPRGDRRPPVRDAARDLARRAQGAPLPPHQGGRADRQGRAWRSPTTSSCAARTASTARSSTPSASPATTPCAATCARSSPSRASSSSCRSTTTSRSRRRSPSSSTAAAIPGALRRDGPAQRRDPRARLLPELRREPVRQADQPGEVQRAELRGGRQAAAQPRHRRPVSDRLDLQADHRHRGAPGRPHHPLRRHHRPRLRQVRRHDVPQRRRRRQRHDQHRPGDQGVLRRLLLHARLPHERPQGPGAADLGQAPRPRPPDEDRPARRVLRRRPRRAAAQRGVREVPGVHEAQEHPGADHGGAVRLRRHRAPLERRRQRQPRRRPGRPAGHAAADGRRLLGARERRHHRPPAPRAARSRTARVACSRSCARPPAASSTSPRRRARRSCRASRRPPPSPGGTSEPVFKGTDPDIYGKTGTAERGNAGDQSWYVGFVPNAGAADRGRGDHRAGRLRCGSRGPDGVRHHADLVRQGPRRLRAGAPPRPFEPDHPDPAGVRAAAAARAAADPAAHRPAADAGRARARHLLGDRHQGRHRGRHRRLSRTTTSTARSASRSSACC